MAGSRFDVVRRVGAGGMGVVYEARDRATGERLAVKTLHEHDATALYRLKKEFRGLQNIVHPNLIQFRELFEEEGAWYLVMELVEGCDALQYTRGTTEGISIASTVDALVVRGEIAERTGPIAAPRDYGRVRSVVTQIASALDHLHARGRVHCDIKPSNVLVERTGRAIVLDLGLARVVAGAESTEGIAGTVPYVAPEQVVGEPAIAASDCYALGVLLYELLTGKLPFTGSAAQILHEKCSVDAPTERLPAATPHDLRELCVALLRRDPNQRPTARDVLNVLAGDEPTVRASSRELSVGPASFFGRERELETLRVALAAVRASHTRIVWVRGPSGVGKTSVVKHFLDELGESRDALVLSARCYEREEVPFKALDGVVDALSSFLRTRDAAEVASFLPRHINDLCAAFPVLARVPAIEQIAAEARDRGGDRRERAFTAFRELLTRLGERRTVALFVDDLQWGDADSMRLLREVLRPPDSPPVLVVLTSRDEAAVDALMSRLDADPGAFVRLDVDVLRPGDAMLLANHLIQQAGLDPSRIATAIGNEAKGHPLHILELVRHASSSQTDDATVRLDDALAARVDRLPDSQRQLLRLVCVSAAPISTSTLQRATEADAGRILSDTTTLTSANLLKASAGTSRAFEPFHDRVREVVSQRLTADELRQIHARLAKAFEENDTTPAEVLVLHFTGCGIVDRAATYASRAARDAEQRLAYLRAAELYGFALEHGEHDTATRLALATRRAHTLAIGGRPLEAAHAFRVAAESAGETERLDLERWNIEQLLFAGELDEGWRAAEELLRRVNIVLPAGRQRSIGALLVERMLLRLRGLGFTRREESQIDPRTLQRLDVLWSVSSGMTFVNPVASRIIQARFLREALAVGEPKRVALAYCWEMGLVGFRGRRSLPRVEKVERVARDVIEQLGTPELKGFLEGARGMVGYFYGDLNESLESFDRAAPLLRGSPEMQWVDGIRQTYRLGVLWILGRYPELIAEQRDLLRLAEEQGNMYKLRHLLSWRGNHAWLVRDDPAGARAAMQRASRVRAPGSHVQLPDYYDLLSNSMIDLYELDGQRAFERVEQEWPRIRQLARVQTVDIESTYLRGCVALAASGKALKAADASIAHLERLGTPYSRMLGQQLRAALAACRGDRKRAIAALHAAISGAEALGTEGQALAARLRLGTLVDDADVQAAAQAAEQRLRALGVVDPRRFANMFTPGLVSPP